jgi:hypothetical protein
VYILPRRPHHLGGPEPLLQLPHTSLRRRRRRPGRREPRAQLLDALVLPEAAVQSAPGADCTAGNFMVTMSLATHCYHRSCRRRPTYRQRLARQIQADKLKGPLCQERGGEGLGDGGPFALVAEGRRRPLYPQRMACPLS